MTYVLLAFENNEKAHIWDGEKIIIVEMESADGIPNADETEIALAIKWYREVKRDFSWNRYSGTNTYIGCEVIITKSRKVKNKDTYTVIEYIPPSYDKFYGTMKRGQIHVENANTPPTWVGVSCIASVVVGCLPWWAA